MKFPSISTSTSTALSLLAVARFTAGSEQPFSKTLQGIQTPSKESHIPKSSHQTKQPIWGDSQSTSRGERIALGAIIVGIGICLIANQGEGKSHHADDSSAGSNNVGINSKRSGSGSSASFSQKNLRPTDGAQSSQEYGETVFFDPKFTKSTSGKVDAIEEKIKNTRS